MITLRSLWEEVRAVLEKNKLPEPIIEHMRYSFYCGAAAAIRINRTMANQMTSGEIDMQEARDIVYGFEGDVDEFIKMHNKEKLARDD